MYRHSPSYRKVCSAALFLLCGVFVYIISFPAALSYVARHPDYDDRFDSFYAPLPEWWKHRVVRLWMDDVDPGAWRMWIRQDWLD